MTGKVVVDTNVFVDYCAQVCTPSGSLGESKEQSVFSLRSSSWSCAWALTPRGAGAL